MERPRRGAAAPGRDRLPEDGRRRAGRRADGQPHRHAALDVDHGTVTFECEPDESHYNPVGAVHGGVVCTLLDSALGCATHTTLPAGTGYTSIEIQVNYLRPVTAGSGPLTCVGRVTKAGRRVTFADAEVRDAAGRAVATASGTLLIFPLDTPERPCTAAPAS